MKVRVLIEKLMEQGWTLDRIRGSHHVFVHQRGLRSIVVPVHEKDIPDFYSKAILKQAEAALKTR